MFMTSLFTWTSDAWVEKPTCK